MIAKFYGGKTIELPIFTITLVPDAANPTALYLFRCIFCGRGIAQNQGIVTKIFPGLEPTDEPTVVTSCHQSNCASLYTFQTGINTAKDNLTHTTLYFDKYKKDNVFFCYGCGKKLAEYTMDIITELASDESKEFDEQTTCDRCKRGYVWEGILQ